MLSFSEDPRIISRVVDQICEDEDARVLAELPILLAATARAAELVGVAASNMNRFEVYDIFNPGNTLAGHISMTRNKAYGAMVITEVNGDTVEPQVVWGTPKMHYPFSTQDDGTRLFKWPSAKSFCAYNKYDGTNVLAYSYANASGNRFVTYKTRLVPVIKQSRFGDFVTMWNELMTSGAVAASDIDLVRKGEVSIGFEMYGKRNSHIVSYDISLDCVALYMVRRADGALLPLDSSVSSKHAGIMAEPAEFSAESCTSDYANLREFLTLRIASESEEGDELFSLEGAMFYLLDESGQASVFKCKPRQIEAVHWAAGANGAIPEHLVMEAVWKAFEYSDTDIVVELDVENQLLDDFPRAAVTMSATRIEKCLARGYEAVVWNERIMTSYNATGLALSDGRGPVMRVMSKDFLPAEMKKVFSTLQSLLGE